MGLDVPARLPVRRVRATGYGNRIGLGVMLVGVFVTVMDNSIVNVAIPSIRTTIGATFPEAELVVAGYDFTFAIWRGRAMRDIRRPERYRYTVQPPANGMI